MSTELAWAAGFFEADGNVYVPPPSQGRGLRLAVAQSAVSGRPPELLRFQRAVGAGTITMMGPNALSKKQRWQWRVQRREVSEQILDLLEPYLTTIPKRVR